MEHVASNFDWKIDVVQLITAAVLIVLYIADTRWNSRSARVQLEEHREQYRIDIRDLKKRMDDIQEDANSRMSAIGKDIKKHEGEDAAEFERVRREWGETIAALRSNMQTRADQIVSEVHAEAIRTRDEYMPRDQIKENIESLAKVMEAQSARIEGWILRLETEIRQNSERIERIRGVSLS